jgi:hypothetical protein
VGKCVVKASPVFESVGPSVGAHEVLSMDCGGHIGKYGLDVPFNRILPLLIGCRALAFALVVFVELVGLAERNVV